MVIDTAGRVNQGENRVIHRCFWRGEHIEVVDEIGGTRGLFFGSSLIQSRMDLADPRRLVLPYTRHIMACLPLLDELGHVLVIGLGGGSIIKFFLHYFRHCQVDVVESCAVMEPLAREFFGLVGDSRLHIYAGDGTDFILRAQPPPNYDLILVDAFDQQGMARSVYVRTFFQYAKALLVENGILAVNMTRNDTAVYNDTMRQLRELFPKGLLRLPVACSRNEVVFGCRRSQVDWRQANRRGQQLVGELGVEFPEYLGRIQHFNALLWTRWLNL